MWMAPLILSLLLTKESTARRSTIVTASFLANLAFSSSTVIHSASGDFVWSGLACAGSWTPAAPTPAVVAPAPIDKKNAQTTIAHSLKHIWSSPIENQESKIEDRGSKM